MSEGTSSDAKTGELERDLGFIEAMTLGGGTMIGAGIFILPGIAAAGAGPASAVSFGIAGFVALLAAVSLSELATGMPIAGGSYHYVNRGLGGLFGSIVGWGMWTGLMFATAFYMIGFGQYIVEPIPFLDGRTLIVAFGLLGLVLILGINYYGTEESGGAQNIMIGVEFAIVIIYMIASIFYIQSGNLSPFAPTGASGIVATTGTVFVTFLGFEIIATVAGEIKDPGRLIPLTMILSVVSVTILYIILMIVTTGVVPYTQLGGSLVPVSDVAAVSMGIIGVVAIVFAAAVAAISSSNSSTLAASRVIFALGRDNIVNDWVNETHSRFKTPHRAIITTGVVTALLISLGLEVEAIVALLAEVASFSFLVSYALVHVSLITFRWVDPPEYDPAFEIPGPLYPAVPILGILMAGIVITQMDVVVLGVGVGIVLFASLWYGAYARRQDIDEGLLWKGPTKPSAEDTYQIAVPVANPDTERALIRLAASTARANAGDKTPKLVVVNVVEGEPDPETNLSAERFDQQRSLLERSHEIAEDIGVDIETHAIIAEDTGDGIVELLSELSVDGAIIGWDGTLPRGETIFGDVLDSVINNAPCPLTVVHLQSETVGTPVALAGPGENAPAAAKRASEFARITETKPVLLNAQSPAGDADAQERGEEALQWVADRAELSPSEYTGRVVVGSDVDAEIIDAVTDYETVCLGLSEKTDTERILFGSIAERIKQETDSNIAIARGQTTDATEGDTEILTRTVGQSDSST